MILTPLSSLDYLCFSVRKKIILKDFPLFFIFKITIRNAEIIQSYT